MQHRFPATEQQKCGSLENSGTGAGHGCFQNTVFKQPHISASICTAVWNTSRSSHMPPPLKPLSPCSHLNFCCIPDRTTLHVQKRQKLHSARSRVYSRWRSTMVPAWLMLLHKQWPMCQDTAVQKHLVSGCPHFGTLKTNCLPLGRYLLVMLLVARSSTFRNKLMVEDALLIEQVFQYYLPFWVTVLKLCGCMC